MTQNDVELCLQNLLFTRLTISSTQGKSAVNFKIRTLTALAPGTVRRENFKADTKKDLEN